MTNKNMISVSDGQTSSRRKYIFLAIAVFVAGTFFRFWDLGGAPLAVTRLAVARAASAGQLDRRRSLPSGGRANE